MHRALGPEFLESVYEDALALKLTFRGIPFARQVSIPVRYRGSNVGVHRLELFVAESIKAVRELTPEHFAVVQSYLRTASVDHGLLLNLSKSKPDIKGLIAHANSA